MYKISIGFSKSRKKFPIGSWIIRLYQGWTEYSHIYIRFHTGPNGLKWYDCDQILHASEGLVQCMSEFQFDKKHIIIKEYDIDLCKPIWDEIKKDAYGESGADYQTMQNIGIAYVDFMRAVFNRRVKNPWNSGWNCSEYVMVKVLKKLYPETFSNIDPNTVTPKDIYLKLKDL